MASTAPRIVHGDDLLYEFFQHVLTEDNEAFGAVPQLLLGTMGVWMPLDVYAQWPVLLPFVVRDPACRANLKAGRPEAWSSPNSRGYLRDDNTLVKGLPRALRVDAPKTRRISGARMGTEFVAAHIWRTVTGSDILASRIPELNSFVPNLVWLPGQIAKLTDREGSVVQQTAQAMAYSIYREASLAPNLREVTERCWSQLPTPTRTILPVDLAQLNWFKSTPKFMALRAQRLQTVIGALRCLRDGLPLERKVVTSRYTAGLPGVPSAAVAQLLEALEAYDPSAGAVAEPV